MLNGWYQLMSKGVSPLLLQTVNTSKMLLKLLTLMKVGEWFVFKYIYIYFEMSSSLDQFLQCWCLLASSNFQTRSCDIRNSSIQILWLFGQRKFGLYILCIRFCVTTNFDCCFKCFKDNVDKMTTTSTIFSAPGKSHTKNWLR